MLYIHYLPTYCIPMYVTYAYISVLLHRCIHPIFLYMLKSVYFTSFGHTPRNTPKYPQNHPPDLLARPQTGICQNTPKMRQAYTLFGQTRFRTLPEPPPPDPHFGRFLVFLGAPRIPPYFDHFLDVCCFMLIPVIPDGAILVPCSAYIHFIPSFLYPILYPCFGTLVLHPYSDTLFWMVCFDTLFWYLF